MKPTFPNPLPVTVAEMDTEIDGVIESRLIALWEGKPAGVAAVRKILSRSKVNGVTRFHPKTVAYFHSLYVHEDVRKHGVGRAIVEHACQTAEIYGCTAISLNVSAGNAEVLPFYAKLGFVPAHLEYDSTLILTKQLRPWIPPPAKPAA